MANDVIPHLFDPNEKQLYLPFVINPNDAINSSKVDANTKNAPPQLFSFRGIKYKDKKKFQGGFAQLGVVPYSYKNYLDQDISYKLLYQNNVEKNEITKNKIQFDDLMNAIPGVQIREFLPDSRLDQVINFVNAIFNYLGETVKALIKEGKMEEAAKEAAKQGEKKIKTFAYTVENAFKDSKNFVPWIAEYIFSETKARGSYPANQSMVKDILCVDKYEFPFYRSTRDDSYAPYGKMKALMLALPYQIYFKLQSCTTTNIYEIPFNNDQKQMYSSNGTPGWDGSSGFVASIVDAAKSVMGAILPNVNIQWSPWYNSMTGEKTPEDAVMASFDLFNDTSENAMNNFIFVNTIIPQNRWIQYGLFQHSPCLYDVKIEGVKRLYMCTGEFKVTQGGVLRTPPKEWISKLIKTHANKCIIDIAAGEEKIAKTAAARDSYNGSQEFFEDMGINDTDANGNPIARIEAKQDSLNAAADTAVVEAQKDIDNRIDYIIKNMTIKIPDVYHVELVFKSLLPASFNTFILQYAENQNHVEEYATNSRDNSVLMDKISQIGDKIKQYVEKVAADAAGAAADAADAGGGGHGGNSEEYYNNNYPEQKTNLPSSDETSFEGRSNDTEQGGAG